MFLSHFYAFLQYRRAVMMADSAYRQNRTRYYVLPNNDSRVRLIVTDRRNFRRLRAKGYIDRDMKMDDALAVCFYCTPTAGGSQIEQHILNIKKFEYYVWYRRRQRERREQRLRKMKSFLSMFRFSMLK